MRTLFIGTACLGAAVLLSGVTAPLSATAQDRPASGPAQLRWKFGEDEKFDVVMVQNMTTEMDIPGQTLKTTVVNKTWMQWHTRAVHADGSATIDSKITRVKMEVNNPLTGSFAIDSDQEPPAEGQPAQIDGMIRPLIGVTMTNVMAPTGKVSDVTIPEEALAGIKGVAGGAFMSAEQLGQMIQNVSPVFPEQSLTPGDSWDRSSESTTPVGVMKTDIKYTYQGTMQLDTQTVHRIDIATQMAFNTPEAGPRIEIGDQNSTGVMLFDNQEGRLSRSDIEQTFTIKVSVTPEQVMEQKITQTVSNVIEPAQ